MGISVFSLFRDSSIYIKKCLSVWDKIESMHDIEFSYYFYENDSRDDTSEILNQWMKGKSGAFLSEKLNVPKYGSVLDRNRMLLMSSIRNKMLLLDKKQNSEYSIVFDSDVSFNSDIVEDFLCYQNLNFSMLTSNIRQNVPCKMGSGSHDSYYDSSILYDTNGMNCMTWSDNPFYESSDREKFNNGAPVEVMSAFGSFAFLKTKYLKQCKWSSSGESEHLSLCRDLRKHAPIYLIPKIKPTVDISTKNWAHEDQVIQHQKHLLENKWNRFMWKSKTR